MDERQIPLFAKEPVRGRPARASPTGSTLRLEREREESRAIAARIPGNVRFGTSSWSFPGWEGIVYPRRASASALAREGLVEYARHPLLRTVGIDRGFYAPIPRDDLRRYASQLPPGFPCCAKAPESVTGFVRSGPAGAGGANPSYLDARVFEEEMLVPFREAFLDNTGPFLLQFPPAPRGTGPSAREFAARLDAFLAELPREFSYAVELREPQLLTDEYRRVIASRNVAHVYNAATAMPPPGEQAERIPPDAAPFTIVRLLLKPGTSYNERREDFVPFDRIVDPDPGIRRQVVSIIRAAAGRPVYVLVNNKAEGCAPATIRALAEELANEISPDASSP